MWSHLLVLWSDRATGSAAGQRRLVLMRQRREVAPAPHFGREGRRPASSGSWSFRAGQEDPPQH